MRYCDGYYEWSWVEYYFNKHPCMRWRDWLSLVVLAPLHNNTQEERDDYERYLLK